MKRRTYILSFTILVSLAILTVLSGCKPNTRAFVKQPNIVLILVDDLGSHQLGSYGSIFYETPHIDKLAREGIKFTNAYAASTVCSPTRASIMTGKYPARLRIIFPVTSRRTPCCWFPTGQNNSCLKKSPLLRP